MRSWREAYARSQAHDIDTMQALRAECGETIPPGARVRDQPAHVDTMAQRRERSETIDAFVEEDARTMKVSVAPMMEADADLQDAVVKGAIGRAGVAP